VTDRRITCSARARVWYTQRAGNVYATALTWPASGVLQLGSAPALPNCALLGYGPLKCDGGKVTFPPLAKVKSEWAWVVKFSAVQTKVKLSKP